MILSLLLLLFLFKKVLDVKKGDSLSDIKKAYFKKAKQYHPDTNKDNKEAETKFKEASEAYEILKDDQKRAAYDQFGHAGVENNGNGGHGGHGGGGFGGFGEGMDINDLFAEMFSGRRRGPRKGGNLQYRLRLSFLEAVHGCTKPINFQFQKQMKNGRVGLETRNTKVDVPAGVESGMTMAVSGEGADGDEGMPRGNKMCVCVCLIYFYFLYHTYNISLIVSRDCVYVCFIYVFIHCFIYFLVTPFLFSPSLSFLFCFCLFLFVFCFLIYVYIYSKWIINIGDLYVEIEVDKDAYFKRDPNRPEDVHVEVPIPMEQAALGGKIELLSLDGLIDLKVPPGSQPGSKLLMRNKGIQRVNAHGRGNQYVHLKVTIPKTLSDEQRELLEKFSDTKKDVKQDKEDKSFTSLVEKTLKKLGSYLK